jgi:exodeoxyribonuclease V gamma subunit
VIFPNPNELFADVAAQLADVPPPPVGAASAPGRQSRVIGSSQLGNPWHEDRLIWAIAAVLPRLAGEPGCEVLTHHLRGGPHAPAVGRLLSTSGRVARLLRQYQDERPAELAAWLHGTPDVPADCLWQVTVWRELVSQLGPAPAMTLSLLVQSLRADPQRCELPQRVSVFGPTRMSTAALELLAALGTHREVHLWLVDPSPASWGGAPGNPLLASAGRDFAGMAERLRRLDHTDEVLATAAPPATLLGQLQVDIAANQPPRPRGYLRADGSVQVHACHGTARQVEVARELVLGLLAADATLQPRDILVMCPDLETFAPLFSAAFAARPDDPTIAALRVRIADRTPEQANEVLAALAQALDLLSGRVTIGGVIDLLSAPAVARRFDLDTDGLARLLQLCRSAGVCWGLDAATRSKYGMAGIDLGTWAFGMDRMVLGVALGEEDLATFGGVLPLDDVGSSDLGLVGAAAQAVHRLQQAQEFLAGTHPLADWVALLTDLASSLAAPPPDATWMAAHATSVIRMPLLACQEAGVAVGRFPRSALQEGDPAASRPVEAQGQKQGQPGQPASIHDSASAQFQAQTAGTPHLAIGDVRWLLGEALAGRPTRANFRTGGLTVAGLVPMRSVPHRVIVLVGMDDGVFPRAGVPDGDDLLGRDPRAGERNVRTEDRQLFLDAIMAAQEHLIIIYCGADDRTNETRPPAVPVAELLDVLGAMVASDPGKGAPNRLVTHHPLQPFDPRNFVTGALVPGRPFSHDRHALAGAIAAAGDRVAQGAFLPTALPAPEQPDEITLTTLSTFLSDPLAHFLRNRLGLPASADEEPPPEQLPVHLSGLAAWTVGDRLLDGMRHGHSPEQLSQVERMRGAIPPGELGTAALREIGPKAGDVYERVKRLSHGPTDMIRARIDLPNGIQLVGTVTDVVLAGPSHRAHILRASYSKFKPESLLGLWVAMLAAQLSRPDLTVAGVLVAADGTRALSAPDAAGCVAHLNVLTGLLAAGLCEPLPMPAAPSYEYAQARCRMVGKVAATRLAVRSWSSTFGPAAKPAATRIYGPDAPFDVLTTSPPRQGESIAGEDNRFAALARWVWDPVLAATADVESLFAEVPA